VIFEYIRRSFPAHRRAVFTLGFGKPGRWKRVEIDANTILYTFYCAGYTYTRHTTVRLRLSVTLSSVNFCYTSYIVVTLSRIINRISHTCIISCVVCVFRQIKCAKKRKRVPIDSGGKIYEIAQQLLNN